jgi:hypothetical protein
MKYLTRRLYSAMYGATPVLNRSFTGNKHSDTFGQYPRTKMAVISTIELRPRSVGELLDLSFSVYRRNFIKLIGITLVVMGPVLALSLISSGGSIAQYVSILSSAANGDSNSVGPMTALTTFISTCAGSLTLLVGIFVPWMDGALTYSVIERVLGHQPTLRQAYNATRSRWGALWVAGAIRQIVLGLTLIPLLLGFYGAIFAGLFGLGALSSVQSGSIDSSMLLVGIFAICLPIGLVGSGLAVFVAVSWSLTVPAIIGEGTDGTSALTRSNSLVGGHRWRMIGRLFIFEILRFLVITLPLSALQVFVLGASAAASAGGDMSPLGLIIVIISTVFGSLANVLVVPFYAIYVTVNYLDLRVRKENLDLQLKAAQLAPSQETPTYPVVASTATVKPIAISAPAASVAVSTATQLSLVQAAPVQIGPIGAPPTPAQRISDLFRRMRTEGQSPALLNEMGLAYQEIGDLYGALDAFTRARTLAPADAASALNLALLQRARKDLPAARQAMADYLRLEVDPDARQKMIDSPALRDLLP